MVIQAWGRPIPSFPEGRGFLEGHSKPIFIALADYLPFIAHGFAFLGHHDAFSNLNHSYRCAINFRGVVIPKWKKKVKTINWEEKENWDQFNFHIPVCNSTFLH